MRTIEANEIIDAISKLCIQANLELPQDVADALTNSCNSCVNATEAFVLDTLAQNIHIAKQENLPLCQDTGMAIVFADIGVDLHISGSIISAINEGVRRGYAQGYLRKSIVADPLYTRVNTKDNTPAIVHTTFVDGDKLTLTVAPKGFGSENMSAVKMLSPSEGEQGVVDFIIDTITKAGGNPCPPIVVGIGIGGSFEYAAYMAKRALLRDIGSSNPDEKYAALEQKLLTQINSTNIGAMGLGGNITALQVSILTHPTHIAGLPIAVNISCHCTRHATITL